MKALQAKATMQKLTMYMKGLKFAWDSQDERLLIVCGEMHISLPLHLPENVAILTGNDS